MERWGIWPRQQVVEFRTEPRWSTIWEQVSSQSFLNPEQSVLWVNKSKNYTTEDFYLPKSTNNPNYLNEFLYRAPWQRLKYWVPNKSNMANFSLHCWKRSLLKVPMCHPTVCRLLLEWSDQSLESQTLPSSPGIKGFVAKYDFHFPNQQQPNPV